MDMTMTRPQIIAELKKHFDIRELVCPHVFNEFGEKSWQFFDLQFLQMLYILRFEIFAEGMIINNWHKGGPFTERGGRCNICAICKDKTLHGLLYMSAHANFSGCDYDVPGIPAEQTRQRVIANANKFPFKIRIEGKVNWNHNDCYDDPLTSSKVMVF